MKRGEQSSEAESAPPPSGALRPVGGRARGGWRRKQRTPYGLVRVPSMELMETIEPTRRQQRAPQRAYPNVAAG